MIWKWPQEGLFLREGLGDRPGPTIGLPLAIGFTGRAQVRVERFQ